MKQILSFTFLVLITASCVSSKLHTELQGRYQDLQDEERSLRKEREDLRAKLSELDGAYQALAGDLERKTALLDSTQEVQRQLEENYRLLNRNFEQVLQQNEALLASNQAESAELIQKLDGLQQQLNEREDTLRRESERLQAFQSALAARARQIDRLEARLAEKDSKATALKKRLQMALLNFDGRGLAVESRDGKVYVSLENRLIFASGSWQVQSEGRKALKELAVVLAENPELNVVVEGHTDSDPYRGKGAIEDNWDLSVKRATSIVKILVDSKGVNPERITAAGRSEYQPVADNRQASGKAKNRRTEIIITPELSVLEDLLRE